MKIIRIGQWEVEYDKIKTMNVYNKCNPLLSGCNCISCQNFYNASKSFENEIKTFFEQFGIDIAKPAEIYDNGVYKSGKILYGGFYHIIGKIKNGSDIWVKNGSKKETYLQNDMYKINNDFEIGFTFQTEMVNEYFPENIFQMEISLWVPWVMEDKDYLKSFYIEKE
jgi:hypothetical protein